MGFNCRFNPSANGAGLHLGHIYMALINEGMAHGGGGQFTVRFDDSNPHHEHWYGRERMDAAREQQRGELAWLGLPVDRWINQVDIVDEVHDLLTAKGFHHALREHVIQAPLLPTDERTALFPCEPILTAERVLMDWMEGTNLLIRGIDLMTEYSLYSYLCQTWDIPEPQHIYLPRVKSPNGVMSKTHGGVMVADLRAQGHTPEYVRGILVKGCLREPLNGWVLWNLRSEPFV